MDKLEYLARAPEYYALAILIGAEKLTNPSDLNSISRTLSGHEDLFRWEGLVSSAENILLKGGLIQIFRDDFGPTVYAVPEEYYAGAWKDSPFTETISVFDNFAKRSLTKSWIVSAIDTINMEYHRHNISDDDFVSFDEEDVWEPIPIDHENESLVSAEKELDKAIQAIESNNGYAAEVPGERQHVVDSLKQFREILKNRSETFWPQVKSLAIDPLTRVVRRFGDAATGIAASAAKQALIGWLKDVFGKLVGLIF